MKILHTKPLRILLIINIFISLTTSVPVFAAASVQLSKAELCEAFAKLPLSMQQAAQRIFAELKEPILHREMIEADLDILLKEAKQQTTAQEKAAMAHLLKGVAIRIKEKIHVIGRTVLLVKLQKAIVECSGDKPPELLQDLRTFREGLGYSSSTVAYFFYGTSPEYLSTLLQLTDPDDSDVNGYSSRNTRIVHYRLHLDTPREQMNTKTEILDGDYERDIQVYKTRFRRFSRLALPGSLEIASEIEKTEMFSTLPEDRQTFRLDLIARITPNPAKDPLHFFVGDLHLGFAKHHVALLEKIQPEQVTWYFPLVNKNTVSLYRIKDPVKFLSIVKKWKKQSWVKINPHLGGQNNGTLDDFAYSMIHADLAMAAIQNIVEKDLNLSTVTDLSRKMLALNHKLHQIVLTTPQNEKSKAKLDSEIDAVSAILKTAHAQDSTELKNSPDFQQTINIFLHQVTTTFDSEIHALSPETKEKLLELFRLVLKLRH